nr:unnamed protein product [Naegleria fowleri]
MMAFNHHLALAIPILKIPHQLQSLSSSSFSSSSNTVSYMTSSTEQFQMFIKHLLNDFQSLQHDRSSSSIKNKPDRALNFFTESESPFHKTETALIEQTGHSVKTFSIARSAKPMNWKELFQLVKNSSKKEHEVSSPLISKPKSHHGHSKSSFSSEPQPPDHRRNWVPTFIGNVNPSGNGLNWSNAPCFKNTSARITNIDNDSHSVTIEFNTYEPSSMFCYDWYFITTRENYFVKVLFMQGKHEVVLKNLNAEIGEWQDVLQNGLRLFEFKDQIFQTIIDAFNAGKILAGMYFEEDKISFLKRDMGFEFNERPVKEIWLDDSELESGDLVAQLQMSGLDCLLMYGTGARIGHIASILKIDGIKYVVESTEEGIRKTKWAEWYLSNKGDSTIVIARLAPRYRKLYNESAAAALFKTLDGNEYGYNNIAYAWIDTENDNYPTPLSGEMIGATFVLFNNWYMGSAIQLLFVKGMNQRFRHYYGLNKNCTDIMCVFETITDLNITINYALTLPERDGWLYDNGKPQMVCSVMYMNLLKAAGIFGNLTHHFESAEFTPKDVYQLDIWDKNWQRPKQCNANNDNYMFCQVAGPWYWPIDDFSTIKPYPHMNERCGAEPMDYKRHPEFC